MGEVVAQRLPVQVSDGESARAGIRLGDVSQTGKRSLIRTRARAGIGRFDEPSCSLAGRNLAATRSDASRRSIRVAVGTDLWAKSFVHWNGLRPAGPGPDSCCGIGWGHI